ncbi:MAG: 30S ribosomal protein S3 [Kiritimatiellae bacterium]|nr:30S ribosomal protein S3 [Kiritimatiellia bacterium]
MGQKVNPIGMRVTVEKDWRSRWFSRKKDFGTVLIEDLAIRDRVKKGLENAAVSDVIIERYANRVRVNIHSARPGVIIGRKGQDIEKIRTDLSTMTGKEIYVEIHEVKSPDTNAQLVAENICSQLERRVSFRRAMKRAMKVAMDMGVMGIKVRASGRLGGAELSRVEWYKEGTVPLHTLRANISYGFAEASTTAGRIGLKVWICKPREEPKAPRGKGRK